MKGAPQGSNSGEGGGGQQGQPMWARCFLIEGPQNDRDQTAQQETTMVRRRPTVVLCPHWTETTVTSRAIRHTAGSSGTIIGAASRTRPVRLPWAGWSAHRGVSNHPQGHDHLCGGGGVHPTRDGQRAPTGRSARSPHIVSSGGAAGSVERVVGVFDGCVLTLSTPGMALAAHLGMSLAMICCRTSLVVDPVTSGTQGLGHSCW